MTNEFKMEVDPFKVASKDASRLKISSPQRVIIDAIDFQRSKVMTPNIIPKDHHNDSVDVTQRDMHPEPIGTDSQSSHRRQIYSSH